MSENRKVPPPLLQPSSSLHPQTEDWHELARKASEERDTQRLLSLVEHLCDAIDHRDGKWGNPFLLYARSSALAEMMESAMSATGADLGNVQLLDTSDGSLKIAAERGFKSDFLSYFARVDAGHGTACGTALKSGARIVVPDVALDPLYDAGSREAMLRARALSVQSTPIVSSSRTLLGVVSTHYRRTNGFHAATMGAVVDQIAARFLRNLP